MKWEDEEGKEAENGFHIRDYDGRATGLSRTEGRLADLPINKHWG